MTRNWLCSIPVDVDVVIVVCKVLKPPETMRHEAWRAQSTEERVFKPWKIVRLLLVYV